MVMIRFRGKTENEYKCLNGYSRIKYDCEYFSSLKPQEVSCTFVSHFPQFGYTIKRDPDLIKKKFSIDQLHYDIFAEFPTVVQYTFDFVSEHVPNSEDEEDLRVFEEKLRQGIESIIPKIIGEGFCYPSSYLDELQEKEDLEREGNYIE